MHVVICDSAQATGDYGARLIESRLDRDELKVLGVATGSTPGALYRALEKTAHPGLGALKVFALDEYVGLPADHPQRYRAVVEREIRVPLGLNPENVQVPDTALEGLESAGQRYEHDIAQAGGIDLQILGIGATGHIGFNEPSSSLASRTRLKTLAPQTREDNARFFESVDDVPYHCLTQGIATILEATEVLLLAHGEHKAEAVSRAVEGPITSMCPASALQLHPQVTVLLDEGAASGLENTEYYRFVEEHRPLWQRP